MDILVVTAINAWRAVNSAEALVRKKKAALEKALKPLNGEQQEAFNKYVEEGTP